MPAPSNDDRLSQIAVCLQNLVPPWLPAYDQVANAARIDEACAYGSEMMAAAEFNTQMLVEVVSFVQLCAAFARLNQPTDRRYVCVRNDPTEINGLLAQHAEDPCPTYTGLMTLLIDSGVLAPNVDPFLYLIRDN